MQSMRSVRLALASLAVAGLSTLLPATPAAAAESYTIDATHSGVVFRINRLGVSNFFGRFNKIEGSFVWDAANPAQSSFEVAIPADTIDTAEPRRDQHLKSPDFFNAKQFPTITFKSKSVKKTGEGGLEAVGDLTLLGVTKEITVAITHVGSATDSRGTHRAGFESTFQFARADFGINYMPDALGKDVTVMVSIEGIRK